MKILKLFLQSKESWMHDLGVAIRRAEPVFSSETSNAVGSRLSNLNEIAAKPLTNYRLNNMLHVCWHRNLSISFKQICYVTKVNFPHRIFPINFEGLSLLHVFCFLPVVYFVIFFSSIRFPVICCENLRILLDGRNSSLLSITFAYFFTSLMR